MTETPKNTDISEVFSTYKTNPSEDEKNAPIGFMSPLSSGKNETPEKSADSDTIKALRIIIDGIVKVTKVAVWSIAVFGGLFIAALATNTMDRAVNIINASLLSKIGTHMTLSGEVSVAKKENTISNTSLTSSALNTTSQATPDEIASKRRAVLEARKAAKLLEEKQKLAEKSIQ